MKFTTPRYFRRENTPEISVAFFAFFASTFMAWYVYVQNLMTTLADQAAHLVFARLLTDSMTPGITQLGTWPPLLHILMMPATAIDPLFRSGLAGAVTLIPIFIVGVVLLYRLTYELTKNTMLSVVAALIYILNPYILYYTVTPMMEVLFITMVIAVVYFMVLWMEYGHFRHLLLAGIFITLASISRYEGIFLIPVAVMIVIVRLILNRRRLDEIEATVIVIGIPSVLGLGYLMVYDLVFAGHPLAFAGFEVTAGWDLAKYASTNVTSHNVFQSFLYLMHSSYYMIGKVLPIVSILSLVIVIFFSRQRVKFASVLLLFLAPFLAVFLALYRGSSSIDIPEFGLSGGFHNERYALSWIGFSVLAPILAILVFQKIKFASLILAGLLIMSSSYYLYDVIAINNFEPIRKNITTKDRDRVDGLSMQLTRDYDFGKILATRFNNDFTYLDGDIPLRAYIYEGNYKYFDQVLVHPWLYARWVIMLDPNSGAANYVRDPIKDRWSADKEFNRYYTAVGDDQGRRLYRLNEDAALQYVIDNNLNLSKIPSLNPSIETWNPETIEKDIHFH